MGCKGEPQAPQYFDPSGFSPLQVRHRASEATAHLSLF